MTKWEYRVEFGSWQGGRTAGLRETQQILAELGSVGWELVSVSSDRNGNPSVLILKRPLVG
jgi:hypothetical protein